MQVWTFANSQSEMPQDCKNVRVAVPTEIKSPLIPAVHPIAAHQASVLPAKPWSGGNGSKKPVFCLYQDHWVWGLQLVVLCFPSLSRHTGCSHQCWWNGYNSSSFWTRWPKQCLNMRRAKAETNHTESNIAARFPYYSFYVRLSSFQAVSVLGLSVIL